MTKRIRRNWKYYKSGELIKKAGVEVIKCLSQGEFHKTTEYSIRYVDCCNRIDTMTHEKIRKRERENRTLCSKCGPYKKYVERTTLTKTQELLRELGWY